MAFGTLKFDTLTTSDSANTSTEKSLDTSYVFNGTAKAWVNFDGTATDAAARDSFNVSSMTDEGTGYYSINFSNNMGNVNYSIGGMGLEETDTHTEGADIQIYHDSYSNVVTTSLVKIATGQAAVNSIQSFLHKDIEAAMSQIHGDLA